jgi:hypothetical protein
MSLPHSFFSPPRPGAWQNDPLGGSTGGNQRERDRAKTLKKQQEMNKGRKESGTSLTKRMEE